MSRIRTDMRTVVIALAAGLLGANAPAIAHGVQHAVFAHDSDKVDGIHAVGAGATTAQRKGKLVATSKTTGKFPAAAIPKVGDSDELDGMDSTDFAPNAHSHAGVDIVSGTVDEAFIDADIARDGELPTAGSGLSNNAGAFDVNTAQVQSRVTGTCAAGEFLQSIGQNGTVVCGSAGDITAVTAGSGLTGGASSGDASLAVDFASSGGSNGTATTVARSDHHHDSTYAKLGTGTGAADPNEINRLFTRRINSSVTTPGAVVARAETNTAGGTITLGRDGSPGGFGIFQSGPGGYSASCTGVNASSAPVARFIPLVSGNQPIWADGQGIVFFICSFGAPGSVGRVETVVTLHRDQPGAGRWVGYVTSTMDQ